MQWTNQHDLALAALQEMLDERLQWQGGYPAVIDGSTIPGHVIVADEDHDSGPDLMIFRWQDVLQWHRDALEFIREEEEAGEECDISMAMHETWPDDIDLTWRKADT